MNIKTYKRVALSIIIFMLSGCASTYNYEKTLNSWVGYTEEQLIGSWGPPSGVYSSGDTDYLTYNKSSQRYIPGTQSYQSYAIGNTVYTQGGHPGFVQNRNCSTTFTLKNKRIVTWRYEGNSCVQ